MTSGFAGPGTDTGAGAFSGTTTTTGGLPELLARRAYRAYRRAQAAELLRLLPPDAVRPLYGRARSWAMERGSHDGQDPMESLLRFCERLLPLPPFDVWRKDADLHADAHVRELERRPDGDPGSDAFPTEIRTFFVDEESWQATLSLYRAGAAWKGSIAFHPTAGGGVFHTAGIFREDSPGAVRSRFRDFDVPALRAFLRSARP